MGVVIAASHASNCVDGWMGRWVDRGCVDGWCVDGWIVGSLDCCTIGLLHRWVLLGALCGRMLPKWLHFMQKRVDCWVLIGSSDHDWISEWMDVVVAASPTYIPTYTYAMAGSIITYRQRAPVWLGCGSIGSTLCELPGPECQQPHPPAVPHLPMSTHELNPSIAPFVSVLGLSSNAPMPLSLTGGSGRGQGGISSACP
eukprot:447714-Pelagomonas_calceolata.AAC.1